MSRVRLTDLERRTYTPSSQLGLLLIRGLTDTNVLDGARDAGGRVFRQLLGILGPGTNYSWITVRCAEEAYERGLIDEVELDYLSR